MFWAKVWSVDRGIVIWVSVCWFAWVMDVTLSCVCLPFMVRLSRSFLFMDASFDNIIPMLAWFSLLMVPLMLALLFFRYVCMSSMPLMVTW